MEGSGALGAVESVLRPIVSAVVAQKQPRQYVNKPACLCSSKTLFAQTGGPDLA